MRPRPGTGAIPARVAVMFMMDEYLVDDGAGHTPPKGPR
jgi:hypothetical protein